MAGKSYTMREMRSIVEYLTERKAYGEIKGRKMWMEFANSKHSTRSWQSLKETFLKRIFPDIQNPYYKLSMDEVRSFRAGYDVAEKEKNNRLEFRTVSEDSSTNVDSQNENEKSTTKKDNEPPTSNHGDEPSTSGNQNEPPTTTVEKELEKATGEDITSAKIQSRNRSSADTVVLEYENAEEVQRALESPKGGQVEAKSKSLKDLLTFEHTAPLTPIVRELLDDFETESEVSDKEPQLMMVEKPPDTTENTKSTPMVVENTPPENDNANNDPDSAIVIEDSVNMTNNNKDTESLETAAEDTAQTNVVDKTDEAQENGVPGPEISQKDDNINDETKIRENNTEIISQNITNAEPDEITVVSAESNAPETVKTNMISKNNNTINTTEMSTQNTGNTSSDTILPNNPEALDNSKTTQKTNLDKTSDDAGKVVNSAKKAEKRSSSQDSRENKRQKLSDSKIDDIEIHGRVTPIIGINVDTPNNDNEPDSIIENNREIPDPTTIEISTDSLTKEAKEQLIAPQVNVSENMTNQITSSGIDVSIPTNEDNDMEITEEKNPCLLSVSLFDEQFKKTKYSDSDSDDEATPLPKQNQNAGKPQMETKAMEEPGGKPEKETLKDEKLMVVKDDPKQHGILESSASYEPPRQATVNKTRQVDKKSINLQRERALANAFGFAHGHGPSTGRKRLMSNRRRSHPSHRHRRQSKNIASNSSEWTSESDSESYVSPPRGRRYRQTRKYLKPKSTRILQDPDEGMLYVIFGKKIYPLVKDGKHIKNFLTYRPDSGSDMEEESYWRQKYVEEKKKVDEVKRLLKDTLEKTAAQTNEPRSPILASTSRSAATTHPQQKTGQNGSCKEVAVAPEIGNKAADDKMVLKIASKNGVEFCFEGGWNQISNAVPQMVQMLQNETAVPNNGKLQASLTKATDQAPSEDVSVEVSSGVSTPITTKLVVDPEVHEKVNKIETEIFKEIEEHDKNEQVIETPPDTANVTKRRGRARKESSSSNTTAKSPTKRTRSSKTSTSDPKPETSKPAKSKRTTIQGEVSNKEPELPNQQIEPQQDKTGKPTTRSRAKTSEHKETTEQKQSNPNVKTKVADKEANDSTNQKISTQRESLRKSKQKDTTDHKPTGVNSNSPPSSTKSPVTTRSAARLTRTPKKYDTDSSASDVRTTRSRHSTSKESTVLTGFDSRVAHFMFPPIPKSKISPKGKNSKSLANINLTSSQANTENSIDSTQGYQDSDFSPMTIRLPKRKRKVSMLTQKKYQNRRIKRRSSYPMLLQEISSDSNNSSYFIPRKSQSTLNSDVYKTDSYQLLVPKQKLSFSNLAPIDETNPISVHAHQYDPSIRHINSVTKVSDKSSNNNSNIIVEICSSSNLSLPPSPELSVVENLSISRDMIKVLNDPTINELQQSMPSEESSHRMDFSEYMVSNMDVSVPVMDQQSNLQKSIQKETTKHNAQKSTMYSDPLLNKVCKVHIENLTLSETLDQRLRDLLLESSKKTNRKDKENVMEVDETEIETAKKTTAVYKKQNDMVAGEPKTKTAKKARAKKRSSTPQKKKTENKSKAPKDPVIEEEHMESCIHGGRKSCPPIVTLIPPDDNANNSTDIAINTAKVKSKQKKDVIKVKIQRPKGKTRNQSAETANTTSNYTDSGINETGTFSGLFLKGTDDSVDLIHNHSETCLLANECLLNSVEFIDNSKSIISVNSSLQSVESELERLMEDTADITRELFMNRDSGTSEPRTSEENFVSPGTVYQTSAAINSSLMTDDLSDDPPTQSTKWYLLSEDETNALPTLDSYGASLKQLFPVSYAVPDLSTISEMSKENGDSRKSYFDTDGDSTNIDPLSLFLL